LDKSGIKDARHGTQDRAATVRPDRDRTRGDA
jgi:hypothetical protein